jgi:hypothetical protein
VKKVSAEVDSAAFKQATKLYAIEKAKGRQGKSCAAICRTVNSSFGSQVKDQTVRDYVQKWLIGVSPKKRGGPLFHSTQRVQRDGCICGNLHHNLSTWLRRSSKPTNTAEDRQHSCQLKEQQKLP